MVICAALGRIGGTLRLNDSSSRVAQHGRESAVGGREGRAPGLVAGKGSDGALNPERVDSFQVPDNRWRGGLLGAVCWKENMRICGYSVHFPHTRTRTRVSWLEIPVISRFQRTIFQSKGATIPVTYQAKQVST